MNVDARAAADRAAEAAARASYGRLVALLARRSRDIAAAEDALSDAFASALRVWPEQGVPAAPEAWLLTAARRELGHRERAAATRERGADALALLHEELESGEASAFPDERLKLLFVCAHPAIEPSARTPLMLQTVLGLDAGRIATAFVTAPAAMSQRLVRAKAKIRDAGIPFEAPAPEALPERLEDVLAAIYAAYGAAWDAVAGAAGEKDGGLAEEAIYLARLVAALMPSEPEPKGLLALLLYCHARAKARRDAAGRFVPLSAQDPRLWSREKIIEAEGLLTEAARAGRFGRFQCEAAIQSAHCQRGVTGRANWPAVVRLYDILATGAPTLGVLVSRAAALSEAGEAQAALAQLDALPEERVEAYQPYWAARAAVLSKLGEPDAARLARVRAVALASDPAVAAFLEEQG